MKEYIKKYIHLGYISLKKYNYLKNIPMRKYIHCKNIQRTNIHWRKTKISQIWGKRFKCFHVENCMGPVSKLKPSHRKPKIFTICQKKTLFCVRPDMENVPSKPNAARVNFFDSGNFFVWTYAFFVANGEILFSMLYQAVRGQLILDWVTFPGYVTLPKLM